MIEHFRKCYDYERDCNAKTMAMLASVPPEKQSTPEYAKALTKMGHLISARQVWLFRLGHGKKPESLFPEVKSLEELKAPLAAVEAGWLQYLPTLTESDWSREFDYAAWDGKKFRWTIGGLLTHIHGHAFYHRGQIAMIVASLGGKAVDTDYVLWPESGRVAI